MRGKSRLNMLHVITGKNFYLQLLVNLELNRVEAQKAHIYYILISSWGLHPDDATNSPPTCHAMFNTNHKLITLQMTQTVAEAVK